MRKAKALITAFGAFAFTAGAIFLWGRYRVPAVTVVNPVRGPAVEAAYATGTVESTIMMPIAARSPARLVELLVDEGSEVSDQQVLARLEDEDLAQKVIELKAREENAADEAKRRAVLFERNAASKEDFERAEYEYAAAVAARKAAEAQASYLTLRAPANGRIIRRDGEVGELIPANQPVFWLSGPGPLRITAEVDEEDISRVKPGQPVLIQADAFPGKIFRGNVQSITPKGDPIARSYRVRIAFAEGAPLLIGMTTENNIIIRETEDALLVPSGAVISGYLWVVKGGRLERREVEIGARGADMTEILSGVGQSDLIVTQPGDDLESGRQVRVEQQQLPEVRPRELQ